MEFEICTSIYSTTLKELDIRLKQAFNSGSNIVEIRIDYLNSFEIDKLKNIISSYLDKCVLTCRPINEGGKYAKSEKDRIDLLYSLYGLQPKFLDIELSLITKNSKFFDRLSTNNTTLIISSHNFEETPSITELEKIVNLSIHNNCYVKIITKANCFKDNYNILALYDKFKQTKLIAFCMGQKGIISRVICTLIGSPLAYASLPNLPTAEGQISISEMKNFYELLKQ